MGCAGSAANDADQGSPRGGGSSPVRGSSGSRCGGDDSPSRASKFSSSRRSSKEYNSSSACLDSELIKILAKGSGGFAELFTIGDCLGRGTSGRVHVVMPKKKTLFRSLSAGAPGHGASSPRRLSVTSNGTSNASSGSPTSKGSSHCSTTCTSAPQLAVKVVDKIYMRPSLVNEAEIWQRVSSLDYQAVNIVSLSQVYVDHSVNSGYFVMERCSTTLPLHLMALPDYDEQVLVRCLEQMLRALAYTHSCGVIHRDVKPDNFLVAMDYDTVKLSDFGLAVAFSPDESQVLKATSPIGTTPYMSPEMLSSGGSYDNNTDVWSLGATTYTLLCGHFPYRVGQGPYSGDPVEKEGIRQCIREGRAAPTFQTIEAKRCTCGRPFGSEKSCVFCAQCGLRLHDPETPETPETLKASNTQAALSTSATNFLRACLCRDATGRVTAEDALNMDFISGESQDTRCLKGALESAAKCGAFSRGTSVETQKKIH